MPTGSNSVLTKKPSSLPVMNADNNGAVSTMDVISLPLVPNVTRSMVFPCKLHDLLTVLENSGLDHIASFQPHGRAFKIHKLDLFVSMALPTWFRQNKYTSFQRQLHVYGFTRLNYGPDRDAYYHEKFLRHQPDLARSIPRHAIKGKEHRRESRARADPNFYAMPTLPAPETLLSNGHLVQASAERGGSELSAAAPRRVASPHDKHRSNIAAYPVTDLFCSLPHNHGAGSLFPSAALPLPVMNMSTLELAAFRGCGLSSRLEHCFGPTMFPSSVGSPLSWSDSLTQALWPGNPSRNLLINAPLPNGMSRLWPAPEPSLSTMSQPYAYTRGVLSGPIEGSIAMNRVGDFDSDVGPTVKTHVMSDSRRGTPAFDDVHPRLKLGYKQTLPK